MTSVRLEGVGFRYPNGHIALESVDLDVEAGEAVAVIGQNGAGKTTMAKLMNGLLRPTSGVVRIGGDDSSSRTAAQISRDVGYVFQNPDDQIFHHDVESEIAFGPKKQGFRGEELESRVTQAAEEAGVLEFLDENPYDLPYAVRKFVTIACTLATGCGALVLDEPTAGQDGHGAERLAHLVAQQTAKGRTVITITHDMEFVADVFDRVVVMAERRVVIDTKARDAFWDLPALEAASVAQPHLSALAGALALDGAVVTQSEFETAFLERRGAGVV